MKARLPQGYGSQGGVNNMLKQAQKMQADMAALQEELENKEYTTTVGGGAISVTMSGKKELKSLKIDPEVVDPDDVEMLEDLVISAVNEVIGKIDAESNEKMGAITGSLNIPGMF
ncbi:MAG: YbaB/EbfC family nucleoid-associated protein [Oscillospiraceae bacterium]|nr:YbaB/EbfC family nucleoid-associated protein [Oscillospiraceae bacterium]